jgi:hypothetical protein
VKRPSDEIIIASLINEFQWRPSTRRGIKHCGTPEACRRIIPRLEAEYGKRLVKEAWRRWNRWLREEDEAAARLDYRMGDNPLGSDSDEERAALSEADAAVRHARRWLPLDEDPLKEGDG